MSKDLLDRKKSVVPRRSLTPARILQRKCACGGSSSSGECEACKKKELQRKTADASGPAIAPPIVHEVLNSPGRPLDAQTRSFFEPRFGHDFSKARIHTGGSAHDSARAVNAKAYTVGSHVVFAEGQFAPTTKSGQRLLARELTHVVQQQAATLPSSGVSGRLANADAPAGVLRRAAIHTGRILDEGTCKDLALGSGFVCCDPDNGTERNGKTKVICANGKSAHGYVGDHSDKESWEVSRAIPAALGVKPDIPDAAVYGDESDSAYNEDKRCGAASAQKK